MGVMTEQNILTQLKKGQGETNQRLDAIVEQLRLLNAAMRSPAAGRPANDATTAAWTPPPTR